jgi:hypothetical protein
VNLRRDATLLSGWLFADLLLALAVVFLATTPGTQPPEPATPTPTVAPLIQAATAVPSPLPTPTPVCRRSASLAKIERTTRNSLSGGQPSIPTEEQLRETFADLSNDVAGLVLTYVRAPNPGQGQLLARQVAERLRRASPRLFPADAIYEPFDFVDANASAYGGVLFQVYLLSEVCR